MRWIGGRESSNVDDRRGLSAGGIAAGGGIIGVIVLVLNLLLGGGGTDDGSLPQIQIPGSNTANDSRGKAADDERAKFVTVVLGYTEDVWNQLFAQQGSTYDNQHLFFSVAPFNQHVALQVRLPVHSIARVIRKYILIFLFTRNWNNVSVHREILQWHM